jgi:hypothetical protein
MMSDERAHKMMLHQYVEALVSFICHQINPSQGREHQRVLCRCIKGCYAGESKGVMQVNQRVLCRCGKGCYAGASKGVATCFSSCPSGDRHGGSVQPGKGSSSRCDLPPLPAPLPSDCPRPPNPSVSGLPLVCPTVWWPCSSSPSLLRHDVWW